jgi:hypothetical protein
VKLVRRRELPVPTLLGALLFAAVAAAMAVVAVYGTYPFLAPIAPVGGGVLVVEGWGGSPAFDEALRRFRTGDYTRFVATGGPIERDSPIAAAHTWAEYAADALLVRGVPASAIAIVAVPPSEHDRTFRSALAVRDWLAKQPVPVTRLDVVTLGPHGRRSRRLYERAFAGRTAIGVISATPEDYEPERWWRTSEGAKSVLTEAIGWAWSVLVDPAR